jgi:uncharacterized coiled-coil protein SlyX
MKKSLVLAIFAVLFVGLLGTGTMTGAISKVALEELVMEQQLKIDSLESQLIEVTKKLEEIENNSEGYQELEKRVSLNEKNIDVLMRIHQLDEESIQKQVANIPGRLRGILPEHLNHFRNYPMEDGGVYIDLGYNFGSEHYNVFNYISEAEFEKLVREAYNDVKLDGDKFTKIVIYVALPGNPENTIEISVE